MLTKEQFKSLKKVKTTHDEQKSKERIIADFKATSTAQKSAIQKLSGLDRSSFYKGICSLKVIISLAQVLDVSPYYYTGLDDEKGSFSEKLLTKFLNENNHGFLTAGKRSYKSRAKADAEAPEIQEGQESYDDKEPLAENADLKNLRADFSKNYKSEFEAEYDGIKPMPEFPVFMEVETAEINESAPNKTNKANIAAKILDEEAAVTLLKSLFILSEFNDEAAKKLDVVKTYLLS